MSQSLGLPVKDFPCSYVSFMLISGFVGWKLGIAGLDAKNPRPDAPDGGS